jgi:hypothetical protein
MPAVKPVCGGIEANRFLLPAEYWLGVSRPAALLSASEIL